MPENEFEKKVAAELGGLKFKPSGDVWLKVEERIRKKKKRRVFVIIFLLAGIALLGYWQRGLLFGDRNNDGIVNNEKQIEVKVKVEAEKQNNETKVEKQDEIEKQNKNETAIVKIDNTNVKDDPGVKDTQPNSKTRKVSKPGEATGEKVLFQVIKAPSKNIPIKTKRSDEDADMLVMVTDADVKAGEKKDITIAKENDGLEVKTDIKNNDKKEELVKQTEVQPVETKIDSVKAEIVEKKPDVIEVKDSVAKAVDTPKDTAAAVVQKRSENKKWKWGLEVTPGISSMAEGLFSLNMNKSLADANYQSPTTGSGGNLPIAGPSNSRSGFAFEAGVFGTKQFTKRSSVLIGLRYAYFSEKINIGAASYPTSGGLSQYLNVRGANFAYAANNTHSIYTNRYHLMELPISYNLQINKSQKNPLDLRLGLKIGRMIGSDALTYDTIAGGIYYKNSDLLNKTQLGFMAGLNWTITNKKQFQCGLGPVFDVHLKRLSENPMDRKKHIFFAGIRSSFLLNPKK